jgi:hypothetical protein
MYAFFLFFTPFIQFLSVKFHFHKFTSFRSIKERGLFFDCRERLHCRIPAAVGLLCVGFWRRVGGSAVFHEGFFFILFLFLFFLSSS